MEKPEAKLLKVSWLRNKVGVRSLFAVLGLVALGYGLYEVFSAYVSRLKVSNADTGFFLEMNSQFYGRGIGESRLGNSAMALVEFLYAIPAADICSRLATPASYFEGNVFSTHPYLISELTSAIGDTLNIPETVWAVTCLFGSVVIGLFAITQFMRTKGMNWWMIVAWISVITMFPVLTQSLLGQAYFDRLLFGPCVVLVLNIFQNYSSKKSNSLSAMGCIFTLALISERGALLAGFVGCGYSLLMFGKRVLDKGSQRVIFVTGVIALTYAIVYLRYFASFSTGGTSVDLMLSRLRGLLESPYGLTTYFWVLSPLLLLSTLSGRTALLVFSSLLPNLLVNIGGADLTGFYTHYHQFYLPVLAGGATIGFSKIVLVVGRVSRARLRQAIQIVLPLAVVMGSVAVWQQAASAGRVDSPIETFQAVWIPNMKNSQVLYHQDLAEQYREFISVTLDQPNVAISAPESFYPTLALAGVRDVSYWPIGVGVSDFVIAPVMGDDPITFPYGDFFGKELELSACVAEDLGRLYAQIGRATLGGTDFVLYRRK